MKTTCLIQFFAVLLLLNFYSNFASAKIVLPSVFSDNMVLQQNSEVAVWGWGDAGENLKIVATWNTADTVKVKAGNDAKWTTNLKTVAAGGPFSIQIFGSSNIELKNVMLGEVWICSGQSNMEWSVNMGIQNGEEEAAKANHPNIRIFHVQKIGADYPQQTCNATWKFVRPKPCAQPVQWATFLPANCSKNSMFRSESLFLHGVAHLPKCGLKKAGLKTTKNFIRTGTRKNTTGGRANRAFCTIR
jgi:sialate O-acetylesterase